MKSMGKKILALVLASCLGLLCAAAARAAESAQPWSKALGDGSYVLTRIEYTIPEDMSYGDSERDRRHIRLCRGCPLRRGPRRAGGRGAGGKGRGEARAFYRSGSDLERQ